jgi:hypothetical protein
VYNQLNVTFYLDLKLASFSMENVKIYIDILEDINLTENIMLEKNQHALRWSPN